MIILQALFGLHGYYVHFIMFYVKIFSDNYRKIVASPITGLYSYNVLKKSLACIIRNNSFPISVANRSVTRRYIVQTTISAPITPITPPIR